MNVQAATASYQADPAFAAAANEHMSKLLARSATDRAFRARLIAEPRAAIAEFNGVDVSELPSGFDIAFIENRADATIVLPDFVDPSAELADAELEAVAGGFTPTLVAITMVGAAVFVAYNNGYADGKSHN
jgi:hypothetical protein